MSKVIIRSTQCRRCLSPLTYIDIEKIDKTVNCKNCENNVIKFSDGHGGFKHLVDKTTNQFEYCYRVKSTKKLLNRDLCKKCIDKDEKKQRKIKRSQRKIGIKTTRRRKKVEWKDKKPVKLEPNATLPKFYLKKKGKVIYTKFSPKGKWKKTTRQKLTFLERNYLCCGNPDISVEK